MASLLFYNIYSLSDLEYYPNIYLTLSPTAGSAYY